MTKATSQALGAAIAVAFACPAALGQASITENVVGSGGTSASGSIVVRGTAGQLTIDTSCGATQPKCVDAGFWASTHQCRADFDLSGTVAVGDIFAFLTAWFAMDPRANFNGIGGITVGDIFDFLKVWFAGC